MRAHKFILKRLLEVNMRPINVTLCSTTWELAKQKANFSGWVRRKLSEEARIAEKKYEYQCNMCYAKFFMGKSKVQGIRMVVDCIECGKSAMKTGVTQ